MLVKVSTTIVIITDSGKELVRTTGKASSTMSSGVDVAAKQGTVDKVVQQSVRTAQAAVTGVLGP